tara:strand:- start:8 stop:136 length:129 start_codon:yes stop_codon:yes gene_type:complete
MRYWLEKIKKLISLLIEKGKKAEQRKAGDKWDSIVEELRKRK